MVPFDIFAQRARTMADIKEEDDIARVYTAALCFFAAAFHNSCRFRGTRETDIEAGDGTYVDRVSVVMTYAVRDMTMDHEPMKQEQLLDSGNVVAIVYSFFVHDSSLRFDHMVTDQLSINRYGLPVYDKKKPREEVVVDDEPGPAQPNPQQRQQVDVVDVAAAGNELIEQFEVLHVGGYRPLPYVPLDDKSTPYWFSGKIGEHKRQFFRNRKAGRFVKLIKDNYSFADVVAEGLYGVRLSDQDLCKTENGASFPWAYLPRDSQLHHRNIFSLVKACEMLEAFGADPIYWDVKEWQTTAKHDGIDMKLFISPGNSREFGAVRNQFKLSLEDFTPDHLLEKLMPHVQALDGQLIQSSKRKKETGTRQIGSHVFGANFRRKLEAYDFKSDMDIRQAAIADKVNIDPFNEYYREFIDVQEEINSKLEINIHDEEARELQRKFSKQCWDFLESIYHRDDLPDSYVELKVAINMDEWFVEPLFLYQSAEMKDKLLSPLSQLKNSLIVLLKNSGLSHSTLQFLPKAWRAAMSTYLPRTGSELNKLNLQLLGGPGTSKSHTLNLLIYLLILGTYDLTVGASAHAKMGDMHSRRMIQIMHELMIIYKAKTKFSNSEKELQARKLSQMSEGFDEYKAMNIDSEKGVRQVITYKSEYTDTLIGVGNPEKGEEFGAVGNTPNAAMTDRFSIYYMIQVGDARTAEKLLSESNSSVRQFVNKTSSYTKMEQRIIMQYCAAAGCLALPMPNIDLLSKIGPIMFAYVAQQNPALYEKLRRVTDMKTKLRADVLSKAIKIGVQSEIGLAGRNGCEFNEREILERVALLAYADIECVLSVIAESVYEMTDGIYNGIAASMLQKMGGYYALGQHPDDAELRPWPRHIRTDVAPESIEEEFEARSQLAEVQNYSLDRVLNIMHDASYAVDCLSMPSKHKTDDGKNATISVVMTPISVEHKVFARINKYNANQEQPPLLRRSTYNTRFKTETYNSQTYVNFNYVEIVGDYEAVALSARALNGQYTINESDVLNIFQRLEGMKVVAPYIPCLSVDHDLCQTGYQQIQSLRYSVKAMSSFNYYELPVVIKDKTRFYVLADFVEKDPNTLIHSMAQSISYSGIRKFNCLIGVPRSDDALQYESIRVRKSNRELRVINKKDVDEKDSEMLQKVFGFTKSQIFGSEERVSVYGEHRDIEAEIAQKYMDVNFPNLPLLEKAKWTPNGIMEQFYGENGPYATSNHPSVTNQEYDFVSGYDLEQYERFQMQTKPTLKRPRFEEPATSGKDFSWSNKYNFNMPINPSGTTDGIPY